MVLSVAAVGYFLILHQKKTLTAEMEKTVVLQGRNIALSAEKSLLRSDPEFELYPLVTRILQDSHRISSISVVDADGVVQGNEDLLRISNPFQPNFSGYTETSSPLLRDDERILQNPDEYVLITPVLSADKPVGTVYLAYSKADLDAGIHAAFRLTLTVSLGVLFIAVALSFVFFRHISKPMQVMLDGVNALGSGSLQADILMPTRNEFRVLAEAFNDMSHRIASAQEELVSKERMERELEIAHEIQRSLLPRSVTPPPGFEIGHYYKSANEVGGDYVDVIPLGGGRLALAMADVSGKGVPGLVVMAMVKTLLQEFTSRYESPKDIVRSLNAALQGNIRDNMFVTFFIAILDGPRRQITMSNAGHNPVVVYDRGRREARLIKMGGPPLGPFDPAVFEKMVVEHETALSDGDLLLQYTDGLNEAANPAGSRFGLDRIVRIVEECAGSGARSLVDHLVAEEERFREARGQFDDITLLAVSIAEESRMGTEVPVG